MIYLSGGVPRNMPEGVGLMLTPHKGNVPQPDRFWAADNGCFTRPHLYTDDAYLRWLDKKGPYRETCLFATAPDVVGDAQRTIERSLPMLPRIRDLGFPVALVGQDGMEPEHVPWDEIDSVFLGGTTDWKVGRNAARLAFAAARRGKWVHMGRVNSLMRMRLAEAMCCSSVDGSLLIFWPDRNAKTLARFLSQMNSQPQLALGDLA